MIFLKGLAQSSSLTRLHSPDIHTCFKQGSVEGIINALQKRDNPWAKQTLIQLQTAAPLSLKVTYKQLTESANMTFDEVIQQNYHLSSHFIHGHDFPEGIRALLIDKDKSPNWRPPSLAEVDDDMVKRYFKPLNKFTL